MLMDIESRIHDLCTTGLGWNGGERWRKCGKITIISRFAIRAVDTRTMYIYVVSVAFAIVCRDEQQDRWMLVEMVMMLRMDDE